MPRRRIVAKRELPADGVYGSQLVTKFINCMMSDGKQSTAMSIVYGSLEIVKEKSGDDSARSKMTFKLNRNQADVAAYLASVSPDAPAE